MTAHILSALLGPDTLASVPRLALVVVLGAQLFSVLAIFVWLASVAETAGELALDVVAGLAGCVGRAVAAIEGA